MRNGGSCLRFGVRILMAAVAGGTLGCGDRDSDATAASGTPAPVSLTDMIAAAPRLQVVEDLRLDADAEDFSALGRIYVGPGERIIVPLPQDQQVRIYDARGERAVSVGRRGAGPGEFESIGSVGWVADTLWVFDMRQRRVTWIAPDGTVLRTRALLRDQVLRDPVADTALGTIGIFQPLAVYADGSMLGDARVWTSRDGRSGIGPVTLALVPLDGDGYVVIVPEPYEDARWMMDVAGFGQPVPFTMMPQLAWSPDGSRVATLHTESRSSDGGILQLAVYDWQGPPRPLEGRAAEPALALTIPYRGDPIPRAAIDSALASFIPADGRVREGPSDLPRRFQDMAREQMPGVYAPVRALRLGLDGSIWLDLRTTAEGRRSLVLDAAGRPIGSVLLPENVIVRQSSATRIWATERDDDGLNSVIRYGLVRR